MDKEPAASDDDSTPPEAEPEEPVAAVPTSETTPVWAQTRPVAPAEDPADAHAEADDQAQDSLPPSPESGKGATPDWSRTESSSNGDVKKAPDWARTVPTSPGDPNSEEEAPAAQAEQVVESEAVAEPRGGGRV